MSKYLSVTWTETLTQTAVIEVPDELDPDADLESFDDGEGVLYDQIIEITGGPVGPMFPIREAEVSDRTFDGWTAVERSEEAH